MLHHQCGVIYSISVLPKCQTSTGKPNHAPAELPASSNLYEFPNLELATLGIIHGCQPPNGAWGCHGITSYLQITEQGCQAAAECLCELFGQGDGQRYLAMCDITSTWMWCKPISWHSAHPWKFHGKHCGIFRDNQNTTQCAYITSGFFLGGMWCNGFQDVISGLGLFSCHLEEQVL